MLERATSLSSFWKNTDFIEFSCDSKENLKIASGNISVWVGQVSFSLAYVKKCTVFDRYKMGAGEDNEERNLKTNYFSGSNWPSESITIIMHTD